MSTKPILFNTEMVQAILEGRKTVTRRLVKPRYRDDECGFQIITNAHTGEFVRVEKISDQGSGIFPDGSERHVPPPAYPGNILYVRETWMKDGGKYYYRADFESDWLEPCETLSGGYPAHCRSGCENCQAESQRIRWKPSIHMPKEAARIFLRVKNVRVERLQDITADECPMEGVWPLAACTVGERDTYYRSKFAELWDSTIKPADIATYGWDANPWVWVIKFEKINKEEVE